jgi:hypothetical protein
VLIQISIRCCIDVPQVAAACETLSAAQKCLLAVLVWAPLSEHISPALLGALLQVVQAAAASPGDSSPVSQCGADAVMCLTEVSIAVHTIQSYYTKQQ